MKSIPDLLHELPIFEGLDEDTLTLISGCGQNTHFTTEQRVFVEGSPADTFFVIRKGRVAIEVDTPRRGPLVIETLGPGDVLGVSWLLPPYRWTFDARAIDSTSAVAIDAACLRGKCDADPQMGYQVMQRFLPVVAERLQATRLRLLDLYAPPAEVGRAL